MQVHTLDLKDFSVEDYNLIGIHTTLEDCKLAYLLNNHLKTQFKKASFTLDFQNKKGKKGFSMYSYNNKKYDFKWFLIANSYTEDAVKTTGKIQFNTPVKTYLIKEKKKVDYFLKIVGDADYDYLKANLCKINKIPQVVTSYLIDKDTLQSKDYLIF